MYPPSLLADTGPPDRPPVASILLTYAVVAAVPFVLWIGANPLNLAVGIAIGWLGLLGILLVVARRGTGRLRIPGTPLRVRIDRRDHSERI